MNKIQIDDFSKINYLSNLTFSTDGDTYSFVLSKANKEANKYESYIYTCKDEQYIQLTTMGKESNLLYLDERNILFSSNRDSDTSKAIGSKYYKININGGEAQEFLNFTIPVSKLIPLDNGDFIVVGSVDPKYPDIYQAKEDEIKDYQQYIKDNADYEEFDDVPFYLNGAGFIKGRYSAIFYYDAKQKQLSLITENNLNVLTVSLSKDKTKLFFVGEEIEKYHQFSKGNLYVLDVLAKTYQEIISHEEITIEYIEAGKTKLFILANKQEIGLCTNDYIYELDYANYSYKKVCEQQFDIGSSICSDVHYGNVKYAKACDDTFYFICTIDENSQLIKYDNGITHLINRAGSVDDFDVVDHKVLIIGSYDYKQTEIYDEKLNQLSNFNDEVFKDCYVAIANKVSFQSNESEIRGFVLAPYEYQPGTKYPVILDIHGGPKAAFGEVFFHEMQYWASLGYYVIYCNPTGSSGRGNDFTDLRGKYGTVDYKDIMNFCDCVLQQYPDMDRNNFFETGGSYGGFMTNWIIGHTDRFSACASQRSISNWTSFYGVSDIGIDFTIDQQSNDPFHDLEKLWWHSPLKYADKVSTPTLFIHSNEDYRCPMAEGMQMYSALVAHGVEAKMIYFKGENHELSRSGKPLHRIKRLDEITRWFNQHKK